MSFSPYLSCTEDRSLERTVKARRTLAKSVTSKGKGLFSGQPVSLSLCPCTDAEQGIVFKRTDLLGSPSIPAKLEFVQGTPRCTILGDKTTQVQTVEHLLAALAAYGIDSLTIEISGPEVPIFDGSSEHFVEMIENAGTCEVGIPQSVCFVKSPLFWSQGGVTLVALPSSEYRVSYTLHYPHSAFIGSQYYTTAVTQEAFKEQIAPCRTFCLYEEIAPMVEQGLLKGGGLENALIIQGDKVLNPEGVRFPNEMARHKILDLIGDFSLIGRPFIAHIVAICSGHGSNNSFAKELCNYFFKMENT